MKVVLKITWNWNKHKAHLKLFDIFYFGVGFFDKIWATFNDEVKKCMYILSEVKWKCFFMGEILFWTDNSGHRLWPWKIETISTLSVVNGKSLNMCLKCNVFPLGPNWAKSKFYQMICYEQYKTPTQKTLLKPHIKIASLHHCPITMDSIEPKMHHIKWKLPVLRSAEFIKI